MYHIFLLYTGHSQVVADGLAPIWRQGISNSHDDVYRSPYIRGDQCPGSLLIKTLIPPSKQLSQL